MTDTGGADGDLNSKDKRTLFEDRGDAGRRLGQMLYAYQAKDVVVLALPRGGVPVAYEIARELKAPLDLFVSRKVGAPGQPELGIGAVAPGVRVLNTNIINELALAPQDVERAIRAEEDVMASRLSYFRGVRPPLRVSGKVVILVDDGLATGATASAALRALRALGPQELVLAVPVCAAQTTSSLSQLADKVMCGVETDNLVAVGMWYRDFEQTSDEMVIELLRSASEWQASKCSTSRLTQGNAEKRSIQIEADGVYLKGDLFVPPSPLGVVLFAHGSGSSRHSSRNIFVAEALNRAGFATLLMDLLTPEEEGDRSQNDRLKFDIHLLANRLVAAVQWLRETKATASYPLALFGASTGAAAALVAASFRIDDVKAVVSRGGRPDLAGERLAAVHATTLLIVGELDEPVLELNKQAMTLMSSTVELVIVPGATHLFEEPGTLEQVAVLSAEWLQTHI